MAKEGKPLFDRVAQAIDVRRAEPRVSPSLIADRVMEVFDAERVSHPLVWLGCHLELRQIARQLLAEKFDPARKHDDEEPTLFEELQWRYPEAPKDGEPREPRYVLLDLMSDADVRYNVARLRAEAQAKSDHADALEAWHAARRGSA